MEETKTRLKIFLWDQFIRPLNTLFSIYNIQAFAIALIIVNFLTYKSVILFWILVSAALIIAIMDIIKYWKSGEYVYNYRKQKYPDYRKAIKDFKKEKIKPIQEIQIEDVKGDVKVENII